MAGEAAATDGRALVADFLKHSPFGRLLGIEVEALEPDRAKLVLPFREALATTGDVVHGGAISSLIDVAATAAAWAAELERPPRRWGTATLTVDFLRRANGCELLAEGRVIRRGRSMCFCEVEATDSQGPVAKGLVVYALDTRD